MITMLTGGVTALRSVGRLGNLTGEKLKTGLVTNQRGVSMDQKPKSQVEQLEP